MGEDRGSWIPWQQFELQKPNLNSLGAPFHLGQQETLPGFMKGRTDMVSIKGNFPVFGYPELPQSCVGQTNEPPGWFYCLPRFRQAITPASNPILKEKLPAKYENITPKSGSGCAQKKFLVFDQSGDQTTLIFSSGIETPVQCLTSLSPKPHGAYDLNRNVIGTKADLNLGLGPIPTDENNGTDVQSEMHEDTEELNALLYSDDDSDYTEDDEVTSTGHSPSAMTAHDKQDSFEGSTEGVNSSVGPTRKRKLFDGGNDDVPSLLDTASSVKPNNCFEYEDDAESSCANAGSGEMVVLSGYKRMRKEKIRETVSVLRSIIPGGDGKDPIMVLDKAIDYLKSLKLKARVLGVNAL